MFQAVVAGHVCLDLDPQLTNPVHLSPGTLTEIGSLAIHPGGCVGNTGTDLADLGAPVRLVADVGDDELGATLLQLLAQSGSNTSGVTRLAGATTSYSIVIEQPTYDRAFWHHVGANAHFDGSRVNLSSADLLHVGYPPILPALLPDNATRLRALLSRARAEGVTTSVDLAVVDPASPTGQYDWPAILRGVLPLIDVLTPSVDDLASMLGSPVDRSTDGLADLASDLVRLGAGVVALTAGERGLLLRTAERDRLAAAGRVLSSVADLWADRELWLPATPVSVAHTTGAGDAATAGLLYGLLTGMGPEDAAHLARDAAAVKVSGRGSLTRQSEYRHDLTITEVGSAENVAKRPETNDARRVNLHE